MRALLVFLALAHSSYAIADDVVAGNPRQDEDWVLKINDGGAVLEAIRADSSENQLIIESQLLLPNGSNTDPSYGFSNQAGTGMHHVTDQLVFSIDSTLVQQVIPGRVIIYGRDATSNARLSLQFQGTADTGGSYIDFGDAADLNVGRLRYQHTDNTMRLYTNATERMVLGTGSATFLNGTAVVIDNATAMQFKGTGEGSFDSATDGSYFWDMDENNNTSNSSFNVRNGGNQTVFTVNEIGTANFIDDSGSTNAEINSEGIGVGNGADSQKIKWGVYSTTSTSSGTFTISTGSTTKIIGATGKYSFVGTGCTGTGVNVVVYRGIFGSEWLNNNRHVVNWVGFVDDTTPTVPNASAYQNNVIHYEVESPGAKNCALWSSALIDIVYYYK